MIDKIEYSSPLICEEFRDENLKKISKLFNKDMVDTLNTYINYNWSFVDGENGNSIIENYLK